MTKLISHCPRILCVVGLGLALQGCAQFGGIFAPKKAEQAELTTPTPAKQPVAQTKPKKPAAAAVEPASTTRQTTTGDAAAVSEISLSVYYLERIFLPEGSALALSLSGAGLGKPVTKTVTTQAGPPYPVSISVPKGASFPLTISATLDAGSGQTFKGAITLNEAPKGVTELRVSSAL